MAIYLYRLIHPNFIRTISAAPTDELAAPVEFSLIEPETWDIMIAQAGSEEALLTELGVAYEIPDQEG